MTYVPNPEEYQQLRPIGRFGQFNCTCEGAAFRCDFHSKGQVKTTGEAVRANSDEPIPDKESPGLNLGQADAAVYRITGGKVNFDTRVQSRSLSRVEVKTRIVDGRAAGLSVLRAILVGRGFGGPSTFGGNHDVTVFVRDDEPDVPILFDPLVPFLQRASWDVLFDAAEACEGTRGRIYAQFTRDTTPDYRVVIRPEPPEKREKFYQVVLDEKNRIVKGVPRWTAGTVARCTEPRYHASATPNITGRFLVEITSGPKKGWFVNARHAQEMEP